MRKYKMELPDAVLAFKLLDTAMPRNKRPTVGSHGLYRSNFHINEVSIEKDIWLKSVCFQHENKPGKCILYIAEQR